MSRYVTRIFNALCLLTIFSAFLWCTPSHAGANDPIYYTIVGTKYQVTPAGTSLYNALDTVCPLRLLKMTNGGKDFDAAVKASLAAGDPDGAPFAVSPNGKGGRVYFYRMPDCHHFFEELGKAASPSSPSLSLSCGWAPAGSQREACKHSVSSTTDIANAAGGVARVLTQTLPQNGSPADDNMSKEQTKKIQDAKAATEEANQGCFEGTLGNIDKYWSDENSKDCVKTAVRFIKKKIMKALGIELKHMETKLVGNLKSDGQGTSPGAIISMPSIVGIAQSLITAVKYALAVGKVSSENAADLDDLLNNCLHISDSYLNLQTWRKGVLNGLCKQVSSLVERQFTQCIRVNAGFDLAMPQFSAMLQCPINISIQAFMTTQGPRFDFDCVQGSPVAGDFSWGGRSLLNNSTGGLENIFNPGKCGGTAAPTPTGTTAGGRIPGVDCAALSTDPARNDKLVGLTILSGGAQVQDGWSAGGSETVPTSSGQPQQITRCDFYTAGVHQRVAYVYGAGSSCNTTTSGFMDNGYETNTTCYTGGYTPKVNGDSIPDACLYPIDCLNPNNGYIYDASRQGTGACTTGIQPLLDTTRHYPVILSQGGQNSAPDWTPSCADFSGVANQAPVCCDPQKQDCRQAQSKNIPICQCDQGDSSNTVIDQASGKCDPQKGGGLRTCCTASLNGGIAGCTTQVGMPASQVCANGDQCSLSGDIVGTDGNGDPITAGSANASKPSPFAYLEVRPDVTLDVVNTDGSPKQCCTTPWCNICPQHYANAYGMAMQRADWTQTRPAMDAPLSVVRTYNNAILGKGWPFTTSTDTNGETQYTIGVHPSVVTVTLAVKVPNLLLGIGTKTEESEGTQSILYPMLHMSDKMETKLSSAQMDDCNAIGPWKIGYTSSDNFGQSNPNQLGYVYDSYIETPNSGKYSWQVLGGLSEPRESAMDYINRLQANQVDANGVPREPIALCSESVKICTPGTASGGVGGTTNPVNGGVGGRAATTTTNSVSVGTSNPSGSAGMIALNPVATSPVTVNSAGASGNRVATPSATANSVGGGGTSGATLVPSIGGGTGVGSNF